MKDITNHAAFAGGAPQFDNIALILPRHLAARPVQLPSNLFKSLGTIGRPHPGYPLGRLQRSWG